MKRIIIAIDGYSGCGKSTTAKAVARALGYTYLDSGAMYRAVTLFFIENYINPDIPKEVSKGLQELDISFHQDAPSGVQQVYLNGVNVEEEIRGMQVSSRVSEISKLEEVRRAMVEKQRKLGKKKGIVMDGRDIGTVVFPKAELKVFMKADTGIRAARRQKELLEKGEMLSLDKVKENLENRDAIDTTRAISPLVKADDAIELDTSYLDFEEQVSRIIELAKKRMN
ncbi:(d)CMP kinase [Cyclobacterium sp.]|uniref:(d)CMP kinase n=1 Tax=Cyclobacterium sp. TaxID=1966343 RepID=UPI0019C89201|nr:(d)CMP kinase [Cyclobacterium sp.]MBD3628343.1 (d)CMP kinase [Cyclobacterium sp.]